MRCSLLRLFWYYTGNLAHDQLDVLHLAEKILVLGDVYFAGAAPTEEVRGLENAPGWFPEAAKKISWPYLRNWSG